MADEEHPGPSIVAAADRSLPRLRPGPSVPPPGRPLRARRAADLASPPSRWSLGSGTLLCRCGASANKPYCDGSHARVGLQARDDDVSRCPTTSGPGCSAAPASSCATIDPICVHAGFCGNRVANVWKLTAPDRGVHGPGAGDRHGGALPVGRAHLPAGGRRRRGAAAPGRHRRDRRRTALGHRRGTRSPRAAPPGGAQPGDALPLRSVRAQAAVRRDATRRSASRIRPRARRREGRRRLLPGRQRDRSRCHPRLGPRRGGGRLRAPDGLRPRARRRRAELFPSGCRQLPVGAVHP